MSANVALDTLAREVTERLLNAEAAGQGRFPTLPTFDPVRLLVHVIELELRHNGGQPFPPRPRGEDVVHLYFRRPLEG